MLFWSLTSFSCHQPFRFDIIFSGSASPEFTLTQAFIRYHFSTLHGIFSALPSMVIELNNVMMRAWRSPWIVTNRCGLWPTCYRWTGWVWENTQLKLWNVYVKLLDKENWKIATCTWLGLETLGFKHSTLISIIGRNQPKMTKH